MEIEAAFPLPIAAAPEPVGAHPPAPAGSVRTPAPSGPARRPKPGRRLWAFDRKLAKEFPILCGVDEVGRGPLAGNVVAACVILDLRRPAIADLNDSKQVPEERREALYEAIREAAVAYGIGECTPEEIDRFNILRASLLAMRRALEAMTRAPLTLLTPSLVLVDGNQYIPDIAWPQRTLVKGDGRSAGIAAASILAKVTRDRQMRELHRLHPEYGFDGHKGYATRLHLQAIDAHGLTPLHRVSFCRDRSLQVDLFADEAATGQEDSEGPLAPGP
jgi:ribonuclease HII